MKTENQSTAKNKVKTPKVFKPLDSKQLETVVGGPVASRGTVTVVSSGT